VGPARGGCGGERIGEEEEATAINPRVWQWHAWTAVSGVTRAANLCLLRPEYAAVPVGVSVVSGVWPECEAGLAGVSVVSVVRPASEAGPVGVSVVSGVWPECEAGLAGVPAGCCDGPVGGAGLMGVSTGLCGEGVGLPRDG
jgi:hypothetical protein